ncbi:MAG: sugar phosphate isomerase/epimerase family protein [Candidatus Bathyarchaeia archaeon]
MRFGFRTIAFKRFPLEFALKTIAKTGYDGAELCLESEELNPFHLSLHEIMRIKQILEDNNLEISAVSLHTDFVESEKDFEGVLKGIEITKDFGHKIFIISPGYLMNSSKQTRLEKLKEKLSALLKEAKKREIILALEPEPGMTIETSSELLDLIHYFNSDNLKVNLDIGHLKCVGESIEASIIALKDYIVHVHLEDIKDRVHKHLVPSEGDLEIKEALQTLKAINYNGFVIIDLFDLEDPESAAKCSIKKIEEILNKLT